MSALHLIETRLGKVEVNVGTGNAGAVLFFPGGHSTAGTPLGAELYTELGHQVITFSRPGYGRTDVGRLTAAEFVPAVLEVTGRLGIDAVSAVVGVSFGGLQAVAVAAAAPDLTPRLALHSCAPSTLPFPDTRLERLVAPLAFGPHAQVLTWAAVRRLIATDAGLRLMMRSLSRLPTERWWSAWDAADRAAARDTFATMTSGSGFATDLMQATRSRTAYRRALLGSVSCPTLITASRNGGGTSFDHAVDLAGAIPDSRLVDTGATTHFAWLGDSRATLAQAIADFLSS